MKRSDSQSFFVALIFRFDFPTCSFRKRLGLPSSRCTSMHMPRLDNPADSPHPYLSGCFAWTSSALQLSSVGTNLIFEAIPALQDHGNPYGLRISLCTLHLSCSFDCLAYQTGKYSRSTNSATGATLDTRCWLNFTGQGLSPCKVHQASLGALTLILEATVL